MLFMLYASQGEFPRFLLAPGTHEEAFVTGWRAFNLAEKHQTPVLVLSDHYLAVAVRTVEAGAFDFDAIEIDRGALLSEADLDALGDPYLRFKITESGVSPRAVPGHAKAVYAATSNEHDERGTISEEPAMRTAQVEKRARKLIGMAKEMSAPLLVGPPDAETTFISWGTTYGPLREAVERLNAKQPGRANLLHMVDLWPFPTEAVNAQLDAAKQVIGVEVNATAQLATLIRSATGRSLDGQILRYDGRAFTPEYIIEHMP
jgi:2-oxoglutarate ferredoxin oxidoreductase subunit alpha